MFLGAFGRALGRSIFEKKKFSKIFKIFDLWTKNRRFVAILKNSYHFLLQLDFSFEGEIITGKYEIFI